MIQKKNQVEYRIAMIGWARLSLSFLFTVDVFVLVFYSAHDLGPSEPSESYSQQGSTLHIADFGDIHVHTYAVSAPLKLSRDCALTILFSSLFHAVGGPYKE